MATRPKREAKGKVEEMMDFVEQPLSYEDARRGLSRFERTHKIESAELFSGKVAFDPNIGSDVLFEWKSYYDFVWEVDQRLAAALAERACVEEVVYSKSGAETHPARTSEQRRQASLCIAA